MLLAIDIGNTTIALGVFDRAALHGPVRSTTKRAMTADECNSQVATALERLDIAVDQIDGVIIGSVVPTLTAPFQAMATGHLKCPPLLVDHLAKLPIRLEVTEPEQVGADRIANAVAGSKHYAGPVIVVDFGTATTFDVVGREATYLGGVIIPGPETSLAELARRAARLFEVRLEHPERVVGKTTAEALRSGLYYGTIGQIDYIIERILDETKFTDCHVVATGGLAADIHTQSRYIETVAPTLTLEGLRLIYEFNRQ